MEIVKMTVTRSLKIVKKQPYCPHINVVVDEQTRTINCAACDSVMDAFDYLLGWARQENGYEMQVASLRREINLLCNEKEQLKKEVSYMKKKAKDAKIKSLTGSQQ